MYEGLERLGYTLSIFFWRYRPIDFFTVGFHVRHEDDLLKEALC